MIDRKIVGGGYGRVFAGHAVAKEMTDRRPLAENWAQFRQRAPVVEPRPGRCVAVQQRQHGRVVLHDCLMQEMREMKIRERIVGWLRYTAKRFDLSSIAGRPVDDGGAMARELCIVECGEQTSVDAGPMQHQRRLSMKCGSPLSVNGYGCTGAFSSNRSTKA